jgi:hypothetical protein
LRRGLVEKDETDRRTNSYAITPRGDDVLAACLQWLADQGGYRLVDADYCLVNAKPGVIDGEGGAAGGIE